MAISHSETQKGNIDAFFNKYKLEKKIMTEYGEEWEDFTLRHMP